jgi:succinate-acetate transporter protein
MASSTPAAPPTANPVPFGLACYGICVFLLSAFLLGKLPGPQGLIGFAMFTGGVGMLIAGVLAFRVGSTFGGTVLTGYGVFWSSLATYLWFLIGSSKDVSADLAWASFAWGIFTGYVALNSLKVKAPLITAVLFILLIVFALVWIANAFHVAQAATIAGYLGIISAFVAWLQSYQGVQESLS